MSATKTVPTRPSPDRVMLLTHVLDYSDLSRDCSSSFLIETRALPVRLGRAPDDGPARLRSGSTRPGVTGIEEPATLWLPDRCMSTRHATIHAVGNAHVLVDEESKNGTFVNGQRVKRQPLDDGDIIETGHALLCYRLVPRPLAEDVLCANDPRNRLGDIVSRCPEMIALLRDLERVSRRRTPVLLLGETGCGKDVLAAHIHAQSMRSASPFVTVDCGAIPDALLDAVFFGDCRGVAPSAGAVEAEPRAGAIQSAHRGTLFLDQVGNTSGAVQAKLLRVVQEGIVRTTDSPNERQVDVRFIAATNASLTSETAHFREDLLRRLAGYVCRLPPLRKRREDLGALASHFLRSADMGGTAITAAAARQLFAGDLAGNIRAFRMALETAAVLAQPGPIDVEHLPHDQSYMDPRGGVPAPSGAPSGPPPPGAANGQSRDGRPPKAEICDALKASDGNVSQAARRLGATPRQVYRWVAQLQLQISTFRRPVRIEPANAKT